MAKRIKGAYRWTYRVGAAVGLILFLGCGENLHIVRSGEFYRSAQLEPDELAEVIGRHGIRTVINLRGAAPHHEWYRKEKALLDELGIELVDLDMSAKRIPHRWELLRLLDTYRDAERPILVHCHSGADRTGAATALYAMEYWGATNEEALEHLAMGYGHFRWFCPSKSYFVRLWQGEEWARENYYPCHGLFEFYSPDDYCWPYRKNNKY